jgi:hypothetical protein
VARAGRALLRLDTGLCVLHEDEVHELLCEQRCCPALEMLTLGGACSARDEEDALDVVTGHAILLACPALRELHCSVESDRRLETETRAQHDTCLAELAVFLSHPAVRCASLVIPRCTLAADTPAARDAVAAALAAQAGLPAAPGRLLPQRLAAAAPGCRAAAAHLAHSAALCVRPAHRLRCGAGQPDPARPAPR